MPNCQNNTGNWKVHKAWTDCGENSKDAMILVGQEKMKRIITNSSAGNNQSDSNSWRKRALIATPPTKAEWCFLSFGWYGMRKQTIHFKSIQGYDVRENTKWHVEEDITSHVYVCLCMCVYLPVGVFTCQNAPVYEQTDRSVTTWLWDGDYSNTNKTLWWSWPGPPGTAHLVL